MYNFTLTICFWILLCNAKEFGQIVQIGFRNWAQKIVVQADKVIFSLTRVLIHKKVHSYFSKYVSTVLCDNRLIYNAYTAQI